MVTIAFTIRDKNAKESSLVGRIYCENTECRYAPGIVVKVSQWNLKKQRLNTSGVNDPNKVINSVLDRIESNVVNAYHEIKYMSKGHISAKEVKNRIASSKKRPLDWIADYIESSKTRTNLQSGKTISHRTIQKMNTVYMRLIKFFGGSPPSGWNTFDLKWRNKYIAFLHEKNLGANTVSKDIDTIKQFIIAAKLDRQHDSVEHEKRGFTAPREKVDQIYLTKDEVSSIENVDLSKHPHLELSRDRFVIECWTGLRYSDITKLPDLVQEDSDMIELITEKTGTKVFIPIMDPVRRVLSKYHKKELPGHVVNQVYNRHLKDIAKLAGIKTKHIKSAIKGGTRVDQKFEKWERVTSHTARRSFATNLYLLGVPAQSIMMITGHSTEAQFMKYICVEGEINARIILDQLRGKL